MTPCVLWPGQLDRDGYGKCGKRSLRAHRVAYERFVGPIPAGMCVLHRCDTPACINTEHLFLGTQAANVADCIAKGRRNRPHRIASETIVAIRHMAAQGFRFVVIAAVHGVSKSHVSRIVRGEQRATT